ncbi:MAG: response regulator [Thermoflavifilum sp.]|nr:response regulator [Thermoflavifilum sp.]MCL6515246.1 response regulator [Alicyclobacillus sp.]
MRKFEFQPSSRTGQPRGGSRVPKARIMIVDDEPVFRMDIREMLTEEGYEVVAEAANGEAAIEQAVRARPDLILMDVKMAKMDGLKAGRIIHQMTKIPIVILTAYSQAQLVDEAKAAGVIGYLVKPVTEADLVPGIEMALAHAARLRELDKTVERLHQSLEARKLVERAKGLLMERFSWTEAQAYERMRRHAMEHRVTLEDVARRVIQEMSRGGGQRA